MHTAVTLSTVQELQPSEQTREVRFTKAVGVEVDALVESSLSNSLLINSKAPCCLGDTT
jgi:hypothetical protein